MEDWNFFAYKTFDLVKIKTFAREQQLSARRHTDCDLCMTAVFGPCVSAHGHGGRGGGGGGGGGRQPRSQGFSLFRGGGLFPTAPTKKGKALGTRLGGRDRVLIR